MLTIFRIAVFDCMNIIFLVANHQFYAWIALQGQETRLAASRNINIDIAGK